MHINFVILRCKICFLFFFRTQQDMVKSSKSLTEGLRRTRDAMAQQVDRGLVTLEELEDSSKLIGQTSQQHKVFFNSNPPQYITIFAKIFRSFSLYEIMFSSSLFHNGKNYAPPTHFFTIQSQSFKSIERNFVQWLEWAFSSHQLGV